MRVCEIENGLRLDDIDSRTEDYPCPCDMGQKWVRERESYSDSAKVLHHVTPQYY